MISRPKSATCRSVCNNSSLASTNIMAKTCEKCTWAEVMLTERQFRRAKNIKCKHFFFHLPTLFSVQLGERDGIKIESAPIKLLFASCKYGNWIIFSTATLFYNLILCFKMKKCGGWKFFSALHKTSSKEIVVQMVLVISPTSLDGVFIVWKKYYLAVCTRQNIHLRSTYQNNVSWEFSLNYGSVY